MRLVRQTNIKPLFIFLRKKKLIILARRDMLENISNQFLFFPSVGVVIEPQH